MIKEPSRLQGKNGHGCINNNGNKEVIVVVIMIISLYNIDLITQLVKFYKSETTMLCIHIIISTHIFF